MSTVAVRLAEWQTLLPEPGGPLEGLELGRDPTIQRLARSLSEARILGIAELRSGLSIRAFSHVGRVRLGDVEITVRPKLPVPSLLTLLRYAFGLRNLHLLPESLHSAEDFGFQDLLIWQLAEEARELLARGLRRASIRRSEDLASPRGRIDVQALARTGGISGASLPCVHHQRSEDILINQVLRAGLDLAARLTSDRGLRLGLRRDAGRLGESVSPIRLDHHTLQRVEAGMNRLTRAYEPALTIIKILHEARGVTLDDTRSGVTLPGFLFDMNRFFQALLARFLVENLGDHSVRLEDRLEGMLAYVPGFNPLNRSAPTPRPDFVVTRGSKAVAVLDAKYRDLREHPLPTGMLYQLATYAVLHEGAAATILYPTVHPRPQEARIEVRESLQGGRRALIVVRPVDLVPLERLITARATAPILRERRAFADRLVFGDDGSR